MATDKNTPPSPTKRIDLPALTKRLEEHADGIENLAAQVINRLVEEIRTAAMTTNGAVAHLVDLVGWQ